LGIGRQHASDAVARSADEDALRRLGADARIFESMTVRCV
jgi:hypothetical protein